VGTVFVLSIKEDVYDLISVHGIQMEILKDKQQSKIKLLYKN